MESWIVLLLVVVLAVPVLLIIALVSIASLKRRVAGLEHDVARLRSTGPAVSASAATAPARSVAAPAPTDPAADAGAIATPRSVTTRTYIDASPATDFAEQAFAGQSAAEPAFMPSEASVQPPPLPQRTASATPAPSQPGAPDFFGIAMAAVKRWFTEGNVPVKIGMLVLLAGVAALLKYASDQGWLTMPIELRLAGVAAAAMAGLVFGWRQRTRKRAFALALQGGAIGILLLTVFAAFKLYALMPAPAALGLSIALVAGLGVLAVAQDSRTLAVLGILAGFLAPIWLSTGSGNHVALFSYYAVLNAAILVIAWWRPWRVLNLLGFFFTFGIGALWGATQYEAHKFASTEPFLLLFFAFYLLVPMLYARRQPASRRDMIDGCLVFGTPLVAFSLQAVLLESARMPLALCALGLGVLYALLARVFIHRERHGALAQSYALLAVGFATLAVPLALSARATASVFALEGAALAWLGLRQQRWLPQLTGGGLQLAAAIALFIGASNGWAETQAIANPTFMGALLIALAGFASAWAYRQAHKPSLALLYYLWGLLWWCGNAANEIACFVPSADRADALLAFAALTGWLAAEVHRRRPAHALVLTTLAGFVLALPLALAQMQAHGQPFAGNGLWAWLAFAALGVRSLSCLRASEDRFAGWAQFAWWLVWPVTLSLLCSWLAQRFGLQQGWQLALIVLPWLLVAAVSMFRWPWLATPLRARFDNYRVALQMVYFTVLGAWCLFALLQPGDSAPLPWLPVLNPMELMQLAVLALAARWLWSAQAPAWLHRWRIFKMASAGFLMVTFVTLRTVHAWGGVAWSADMLGTSLAQTSLTVVWSVLGVLGWVIGSRRGHRGLWLAGAVLMGVVLAKLVFVDRQHLGNLLGIGSFIAYGLLCTLVGYFAPAPPRAPVEELVA